MSLLIDRRWMATVVAVLAICQPARGQVTVRFDPPDRTVLLGEEFTLDILADITDPVVGWGLDLSIADSSIISQVGDPLIGPNWTAAYAPDGDNLAALAFPGGIVGTDVLLATLTFSADTMGQTDLFSSVTGGDLTEGFALDPAGFAAVTFEAGHVVVVPEPAMLSLLILGWAVIVGKRDRPLSRLNTPPAGEGVWVNG